MKCRENENIGMGGIAREWMKMDEHEMMAMIMMHVVRLNWAVLLLVEPDIASLCGQMLVQIGRLF